MSEPKTITPVLKIVAGVVAAVVAYSVAYSGVNQLFRKSHGVGLEKSLENASKAVNETCPKAVDAETRLDSTSAGPGKQFTYHYTLNRRKKADIDRDDLATALRPGILEVYKTSPGMKSFRDNGVILHYRYSDQDGAFVTEIVLGPDDLRK